MEQQMMPNFPSVNYIPLVEEMCINIKIEQQLC